jgi:hypothetical protein
MNIKSTGSDEGSIGDGNGERLKSITDFYFLKVFFLFFFLFFSLTRD